MYQAIYKCRLCGENFTDGNIFPTRLSAILTEGIKEGDHDCKDGNIGIGDIQGFKKVGD